MQESFIDEIINELYAIKDMFDDAARNSAEDSEHSLLMERLSQNIYDNARAIKDCAKLFRGA